MYSQDINPPLSPVRELLSPPLAGGVKGEGENKWLKYLLFQHPHLYPPPSRGRNLEVVGQPLRGDFETTIALTFALVSPRWGRHLSGSTQGPKPPAMPGDALLSGSLGGLRERCIQRH